MKIITPKNQRKIVKFGPFIPPFPNTKKKKNSSSPKKLVGGRTPTPLKHISQNRNLPQFCGVEIQKNMNFTNQYFISGHVTLAAFFLAFPGKRPRLPPQKKSKKKNAEKLHLGGALERHEGHRLHQKPPRYSPHERVVGPPGNTERMVEVDDLERWSCMIAVINYIAFTWFRLRYKK